MLPLDLFPPLGIPPPAFYLFIFFVSIFFSRHSFMLFLRFYLFILDVLFTLECGYHIVDV